jgi:hypothetical protein
MLTWFAKRRRRKMILKGLGISGSLLREWYGVSDTYSVSQVTRSVEDKRIPGGFVPYGCAVFLEKDDFDAVKPEPDPDDLYWTLRQEIADLCFEGEIDGGGGGGGD